MAWTPQGVTHHDTITREEWLRRPPPPRSAHPDSRSFEERRRARYFNEDYTGRPSDLSDWD